MKSRNASITCLPASPRTCDDCAQRKVRGLAALVLMVALSMPSSLSAQVKPFALPDEIAEAEAFALGYQAYILGAVYARSQLLMEKDTHPKSVLYAALNKFDVYPGLATPASAIDFTPNNDTVYALAWLDLRQGPVLMTIPEIPSRYWTVQATDWALNTLDYVGARMKSKAGIYAYVPPGWRGSLPEGVTRIESTTSGVFLQARIVVQPEVDSDIAAVVAQLKTFQLEPMNKEAVYPQADADRPVPDPKLGNPVWQSLDFFTLLNRAWTFGGVRAQDAEVAKLARALGIGVGLTFDAGKLTEAQRRGLERAVKAGFHRLIAHAQENGELRNGWRYATNLGRYGDNHLLASAVGMVGYGGNLAEEAMYLPAFTDQQGEPLTGERRYRLHFAADQLPPVDAFWSVTLYSIPENQLKANPINRYAFGDRTPGLIKNADGSLTIHVQKDKPEGDAAYNWLPTGEGPFWAILRMYMPTAKALTGGYEPPAIVRVNGSP